ncbi:MAG: hypothetical protein H0W48_09070 [Methylibium sp.]|nr:hypothetical protein [Methylibium sp.]
MNGPASDAAFIRTVEALVRGCHGNEAGARRIVIELGLPSSKVRRFERELDTLLVVRLLQDRVARADIRNRLMARGWSRRGAYRLIDDALRRRGPCFGTPPGDDLATETNRRTA